VDHYRVLIETIQKKFPKTILSLIKFPPKHDPVLNDKLDNLWVRLDSEFRRTKNIQVCHLNWQSSHVGQKDGIHLSPSGKIFLHQFLSQIRIPVQKGQFGKITLPPPEPKPPASKPEPKIVPKPNPAKKSLVPKRPPQHIKKTTPIFGQKISFSPRTVAPRETTGVTRVRRTPYGGYAKTLNSGRKVGNYFLLD